MRCCVFWAPNRLRRPHRFNTCRRRQRASEVIRSARGPQSAWLSHRQFTDEGAYVVAGECPDAIRYVVVRRLHPTGLEMAASGSACPALTRVFQRATPHITMIVLSSTGPI